MGNITEYISPPVHGEDHGMTGGSLAIGGLKIDIIAQEIVQSLNALGTLNSIA